MNDATLLTLGARRLVLRGRGVGEVVAAIGIETVAALFRHTPPTDLELERAIDAIEDALMATRLGHTGRGVLTTSSASLRSLPSLASDGAVLSLEQVESLFQRLAAAGSGPTTAPGALPADREAAAALLILRETMHHLGFERVQMLATN